jgi:hypothetical protein
MFEHDFILWISFDFLFSEFQSLAACGWHSNFDLILQHFLLWPPAEWTISYCTIEAFGSDEVGRALLTGSRMQMWSMFELG